MNTNKSETTKKDSANSANDNNKKKKLKERRRRKNLIRKTRKEFERKFKFSVGMSNWAQNFTKAANWQMKHELAYWKARAKALEYENGLLHDIIRKNHLEAPNEDKSDDENEQDNGREENPQDESESNEFQNENLSEENCEEDMEEDNNEFVVSEEFIEFVKANAKYKEDARRERERLKQQEEQIDKEEVSEVLCQEQLKELYGEKWQRICALEVSLACDFLHKKDEMKPNYWPNIPLNL